MKRRSMNVKTMAKKVSKWFFILFIAAVIIEAIIATGDGQTPWIIITLQTLFS